MPVPCGASSTVRTKIIFNADRACQSCIHEQPSLLSLNNCTARPYQGMPNPWNNLHAHLSLCPYHYLRHTCQGPAASVSLKKLVRHAAGAASMPRGWLAFRRGQGSQQHLPAAQRERRQQAACRNQASAALPQPQTASESGSISSLSLRISPLKWARVRAQAVAASGAT